MIFSRVCKQVFTEISNVIEKYATYRPCSLSLQQLVDFAKTGSQKESYLFLKKELLVRLANTMKEIELLPEPLLNTMALKIVNGWFIKSFCDLLKFDHAETTEDNFVKFTDTLTKIYHRHSTVVETVAEGLMELKNNFGTSPLKSKGMQYFLNRFYLMRISNRMLMNQHIMRFAKLSTFSKHEIDRINPHLDVIPLIEDAFEDARFLCEQSYLTSPTLKIHQINNVSSEENITMAYVPSHLYHIVFELFKNAMRAVVEFNGADKSEHDLPPIEVLVVRGHEDLALKVQDRGGGIPRSVFDKLFSYTYTTAPKPARDDAAPMAGLGYGLPLSRLYTWYFHGDLFLVPVEGYGTDACVYLKALAVEANELLPYFNVTTRNFYSNSDQSPGWVHASGLQQSSDCTSTVSLSQQLF